MLEPGTLWARLTAQTEHALQCGALQPIQTQCEFVEQDSVRFLVQVLPSLGGKNEAQKKQNKETATSGKEFNPFLPYEPDLFVADISDTHVCLLNKFSVIKHHLLIVTREFEEQENLLTKQDFEAMWACLAEFEGLAFYNAGKSAGASQRHKHLQIVPLPLVSGEQRIPIEPVLASAKFDVIGKTPGFPFVHAIARLDPQLMKSPSVAVATLECYHNMLCAVGLEDRVGVSQNHKSAYNLLVTRQWMLLVPRIQECFESLSVNSLGFAGTLAVRSEQQMKILKDHGPMTVLTRVAVPLS